MYQNSLFRYCMMKALMQHNKYQASDCCYEVNRLTDMSYAAQWLQKAGSEASETVDKHLA